MNVIPIPAHWETQPGAFSTDRLDDIRLEGWDASPPAARRLRDGIHRVYGTHPKIGAATGSLTLRANPDLVGDGVEAERYRLTIDRESIVIEAGTSAGASRATSTFLQLIDSAPAKLDAILIDDVPAYRWRGMHLDVCRHFFDVDFVERYLDLLALHRLNVFHWHLTEDQGWRLAIDRYPELSSVSAWRREVTTSTTGEASEERYGGSYTADDIRRVVAYAAERDIQVVPEIELPGHAVAALAAYPHLSCTGGPFEVETTWGIFDDVYCAGNDEVFQFLADVFDEVCALFPGPYVHIGGDECPKVRWESCRKCRARMDAEGLRNAEELQSWFVRRASQLLAARGKRLVGWDEILEGGLAPDATVMSWRGTQGAIEAARSGHDVVLSPTSHCYFDYQQCDSPVEPGAHGVTPLETVYEFDPTPPELDATGRRHVLGGQGNVWTERMVSARDVDYMTLPRMCALSESLWSPAERRNWSDFRSRLSPHLELLTRHGYNFRSPDA